MTVSWSSILYGLIYLADGKGDSTSIHIEAGPAVKTTVTRLDFASFDQILEGYN